MLKSCLTMMGVMLMMSTVAQNTAKDWEKVPKHFEYKSDGLSCKVRYDGMVTGLKTEKLVILDKSLLSGNYKILDGSKHKPSFSQYHDRKEPLWIKDLGDNKYLLKKTGVMANSIHKPGAKYLQSMSLTPNKIKFAFEVELLVPLAAKSELFSSGNYLPVDVFKGKKLIIMTDKGEKELVFPEVYSSSTPLKAFAKNAKIFLNDKTSLNFIAGAESKIYIFDSRSYGSKSFHFDVSQNIPYTSEPKVHPAGTKFKWSFEIILQK